MKNVFILFIAILLFHCQKEHQPTSVIPPGKQIVILYTNDEHGWMEPNEKSSGAAGLVGMWKKNEIYGETNSILVLSGGDMWTGPAISTLTAGKSMVEVMNAMDYSAAALGNHEFDFGLDTLRKRVNEMTFPILAANIIERDARKQIDFVLPYILKEVNDVSVGIIGLASLITARTTKQDYVKNIKFLPYTTTLKKIVPEVKSKGAELIIVIGHICHDEQLALVSLADSLGIAVIGGGHCHKLYAELNSGIALIQSGMHLENYVKVEILFDQIADTVMSIQPSYHSNMQGIADSTVNTIVNHWRTDMDDTLGQVVGFTDIEIPEESVVIQNMITDSWLFVYPAADIAVTNTGGIRQAISAGEIYIETIFGVLPFQNTILELELTGSELINCIEPSFVYSGMTSVDGYWLSDGTPINNDSTYSVLTNDFLYGQSYTNFKKYDNDPYDTGIHYRQPLIDWLQSMGSNSKHPINAYLDTLSRR